MALSSLPVNARHDARGPFEEYQTYILSPEWAQRSRAQRRLRRGCELCSVLDQPVEHVTYAHHLHYATFRAERVAIDLLTVCDSCHLRADRFRERFRLPSPELTPAESAVVGQEAQRLRDAAARFRARRASRRG